eukprot:TRINITY_DN32619_c0_g1_i1.p1 TRINITY_DN32619_c0_g1~~TRINITY_DN32619_c0_g1_i1.p1  ORF type:complete len:295 (+),score=38.61 TRINITY_DN32619_c0_g1_i1:158-1042(+)
MSALYMLPRNSPPSQSQQGDNRSGWESRLLYGIAVGGALGGLAGAALATATRRPVGAYAGAIAVNSTIAATTLFGLQEVVRELRYASRDDLLNSLLAGLGSGALLGALHGGGSRSTVVRAAVAFAGLGVCVHFSSIKLRELRFRQVAARLAAEADPLLASHPASHDPQDDPRALSRETLRFSGMISPRKIKNLAGTVASNSPMQKSDGGAEERGAGCESRKPGPGSKTGSAKRSSAWQWPEWMPIQRYDRETAAKRAKEQEADFARRVRALHGEDSEVPLSTRRTQEDQRATQN